MTGAITRFCYEKSIIEPGESTSERICKIAPIFVGAVGGGILAHSANNSEIMQQAPAIARYIVDGLVVISCTAAGYAAGQLSVIPLYIINSLR